MRPERFLRPLRPVTAVDQTTQTSVATVSIAEVFTASWYTAQSGANSGSDDESWYDEDTGITWYGTKKEAAPTHNAQSGASRNYLEEASMRTAASGAMSEPHRERERSGARGMATSFQLPFLFQIVRPARVEQRLGCGGSRPALPPQVADLFVLRRIVVEVFLSTPAGLARPRKVARTGQRQLVCLRLAPPGAANL